MRLKPFLFGFTITGTNTPPTIAASPVSALPPPVGVNGYSTLPALANGQPAADIYSYPVHSYHGAEQILLCFVEWLLEIYKIKMSLKENFKKSAF